MQDVEKKWYQYWWAKILLGILFFILIILVAFGFYVYDTYKNLDKNQIPGSTYKNNKELGIKDNSNYWLGATNPKITIYYYSDFACPICKSAYTKIKDVAKNYGQDVKIIVKDFLLHDESADLALAARCAGEQGKFWLMHDMLFYKQGIKTEIELTSLAKDIGLDTTKFTQCFDNKKYLPNIRQDFMEAQDLGLEGTPTWIIDGEIFSGDIPNNVLTNILNKKLNK